MAMIGSAFYLVIDLNAPSGGKAMYLPKKAVESSGKAKEGEKNLAEEEGGGEEEEEEEERRRRRKKDEEEGGQVGLLSSSSVPLARAP